MQLELADISKTFGPLKANQAISYTFESGQTYAILGENGAGKSTLMKIIAGYQAPDAGGQIRLDGQKVEIKSPQQALQLGIGMLYQDPLDFPPMTVLENFVVSRLDQNWLPDWSSARAELRSLCERFGFRLNPDDLIETLRMGERQQLEIVRLLSQGVRFLILDEPTTGISEEQRQKLFQTLRELAKDGLTVAIVTHKLADVEALCDKGFVLRHGKITGTFTTPTAPEDLVKLMFGESPAPLPRPDAEIGKVVLSVKDLSLQTHLVSLEKMNLEVKAGEVIGLAGLDGSGQVVFMRACAGLERLSWQNHALSVIAFILLMLFYDYLLSYSGTVFTIAALVTALVTLSPLAMALIKNLRPRENHILFEGDSTQWLGYGDLRERGLIYLSAGRLEEGLIAGLNLTQHFALVVPSVFINWWERFRQTQKAIQTYDIRGQASSPIQTLSGGNQQRVALAMLPDNLKLAFLENPTRGLDVNSARNIWALLLDRRKTGAAIVFSSPDLDEIVQYSDRVIVFSSGHYTLVEKSAITPQYLGLLIGGKRDI